MTLAEAFRFGLDPFAWSILPTIDIGPLAISPHGIGIAVGYLAGAQLMVRRARRLGGPDEADIWNTLFWGLLGAMIGARVGYVLGHFSEVTDGGSDLLGVFRVWEGGISLLGGITGGVLFAYPYVRGKNMGFWRMTDLAAPSLALGIVIGRIGDLIIGDHLGDPTDLPFGWRCLGSDGEPPRPASEYMARLEAGDPPSLGCFDITLHQTALYDFVSTALLLGLLLVIGRVARNPGLLSITYVLWYGSVRLITDFLRNDKRYFGLTGSQIWAAILVAVCVYLLLRYRGAPPRWRRPPPEPPPPTPTEPPSQVPPAPTEPPSQGPPPPAPEIEGRT